jgi:hypothetical protein
MSTEPHSTAVIGFTECGLDSYGNIIGAVVYGERARFLMRSLKFYAMSQTFLLVTRNAETPHLV